MDRCQWQRFFRLFTPHVITHSKTGKYKENIHLNLGTKIPLFIADFSKDYAADRFSRI